MGNIEISEEYWNSNLRESSSWRELGEKIESVLGATIVLLFLISPNIRVTHLLRYHALISFCSMPSRYSLIFIPCNLAKPRCVWPEAENDESDVTHNAKEKLLNYIYIYISGSEMQILYLEVYRVQAFKVIKFSGDEARSGRSTNEICLVIYERAVNRCHGDESKAIVNSRLNLHTRSDIVPWHGDKKPRCGYLLLGTMKYIRGTEYCFTSAIDHRDSRSSQQFFRIGRRV